MDIFKTRSMLALGLSGAMSMGAAQAGVDGNREVGERAIVAISGPDVRITVYDGIATVVGIADTVEEAGDIENQLSAVDGVDHVINLLAWRDDSEVS